MIHDGWSPYNQFKEARHQQCLNEMEAAATRGAIRFARRVAELLRTGQHLRDRHAAGEISRHGLAVARGRLENQLADLIFPPKTNAANERLARHLWAHRDDLFTIRREPGLDATNRRAELAIRFGVILREVWGGSRTWAGARVQSILMSVWRARWQQGRSALDFLSRLLRGTPGSSGLAPVTRHANSSGRAVKPRRGGAGCSRPSASSPAARAPCPAASACSLPIFAVYLQ
jgi:hypothetical protein